MPDSVEERFRKIFEFSGDAIFIIDPAKNAVLAVNPKACTILGYARDEILAKPFSALFPKDTPSFEPFAQAVFQYGQGWTNALPFVTKDGQRLTADISGASLEIESASCLLLLVRDNTAMKQVEAALRQVSDELEQVVEEKTFELKKAHEIVKEQAASRSVAEKALRKLERQLRQFQKMDTAGPAPRRRRDAAQS